MRFAHTVRLLATVCYADIFSWPLTDEELLLWSIGGNIVPPKLLPKATGLQRLKFGDRVFTFLGSRQNIAQRIRRETIAVRKWQKARRAAALLSRIPTISFIGITGGLARNSTQKDDDIDMFIISATGTAWVTRLLCVLFCEFLGVRRRPASARVSDKVCLNMFMDEAHMCIPQKEQDLFGAYEVLQMVPLWNTQGAYRNFLRANQWVEKFLPNAWREKYQASGIRRKVNTIHETSGINIFFVRIPVSNFCLKFWIWILRRAELPSRKIQLWYMKRRRTREVIGEGIMRFHPNDARIWIKREFGRRLTRFNIPLDKIFYGS